MADQETHTSRAEQRSAAVARLKRAASLPRMKDGRRPPMHVEAVSEGEKPQSEEEKAVPKVEKMASEVESTTEQEQQTSSVESKATDPDSDLSAPTEKAADADLEADTELEERPISPTAVFKKRRSRSRSRSRGSKDFKGKFKLPQSPVPQIGGDSSQDENPSAPSPLMLPMIPPLAAPVPHFPFLQQNRFLRSPTPLTPDLPFFHPGTPSPSTPLPTLTQIQEGLIRSNSATAGSSSAAGRRMAMHKLTGGTESYDPSPSPTPPPFANKLSRNNTVTGAERNVARTNLLNRLNTRITKEADAEAASGAEDRGAASPTPKRRRRRSRRTSTTPNPNITVSDSDFNSTNPNTPANLPTPLPILQDHYNELRALSTTPNQLSSSRNQSSERIAESNTPPPPLPISNVVDEDSHEEPRKPRRGSVLVEEEDVPDVPPERHNPPVTQHTFNSIDLLRAQQNSSKTPSNGSSDSGPPSAIGVPIFFSHRAPSRNEPFPSSPFTTPLKKETLTDEDEVVYTAGASRPRTPYAAAEDYEREISWIASPVPEARSIPIHHESEDEDEDEDEATEAIEVEVRTEDYGDDETPASATSSNGFSPEAYDDTSPRVSSSSKSISVKSELSPENLHVYRPVSSSSPIPFQEPLSVDGSISPQFLPTRLSVASRIQSTGDRSPLTTEFSEWEEKYGAAESSKREPSSPWEKAKNMFSRAGSSTGRRSRTNSVSARERRDHTDSSISRESGASLTSAKTDKGDASGTPAPLQAPALMQTPSASASILSLAPHVPSRGSVSPIPPPSSSDMSKYQNAKLFPFPGMLKLEEERRLKSNADVSQSNDDVQAQPMSYSFSNSPAQTPDAYKDQGPTDHNPDQRLYAKHGADSNTASSSYYPGLIDVSPSPQQNGSSYNLKLPTTLPGVKQWLSKNSKKKAATPPGSAPGTISFSPMPVTDTQTTPITNKKPSLSDLFGRKNNEVSNEWEENAAGSSKINGEGVTNKQPIVPSGNGVATVNEGDNIERTQTPRGHHLLPSLDFGSGRGSPFKFPSEPSANRLTAATPDPSSVSDYPAPTASESSSTTSSQSSSGLLQGPLLLERLEENLSKGFKIDDPPRKLVLSSPVLQVVNPNTVKDRFLFLFNDILVIAKPVTFDQDNLMDTYKLSVPDRKYTVKSVVQLRNIRFCADRSEAQGKLPASVGPRNTLLRSFVAQFSKEPDHAIAALFTKSNLQDNPALLGQLLFKTLELDRSRLGEYLSRRTSKIVLKSYLDSFGFAGLGVDVALRVFLQSINVSRHAQSYAALDHLLDSFASRWYEANAKFVTYDKDMAVRLVRALANLNERLHGGITDEPGPTDHIRRNVTSKEFLDAFRRYDTRSPISDELLQELYRSVFHERLCQASPTSVNGPQDIPITIRRPLPTRLTYKVQSDPIVFRLPQADPGLTIELHGQDMVFDPPVLQFSKSADATFRIMGTSLGSKSVTMCRSGPSAIKYTGIPYSHTIVVERAFMRNTFQLAFVNQTGAKRRYMFSLDDLITRNAWATSLRRLIDSSMAAASTPVGLSPEAQKIRKAADAVAFKVLQETLMGNYTPTHRMNDSYSTQNSSDGLNRPQFTGSSVPFSGSMHARSKSRSRVYHEHGAGKNELDLGDRLTNTSPENNGFNTDSSKANTPEQVDGSQWTGRDLEIHCQQNSTISLVLSILQNGVSETTPPPT